MKIPFNKPFVSGFEKELFHDVIINGKFCGDGDFTARANKQLEETTKARKALLTTSCTHALEMAAILVDIQPGDEVIMPSFTFVSTANAFALRGARIVFIDIRPDTMNIDENLIENAITNKTKGIVPVHYGGVGCNMDKIIEIARKYDLFVIEDAAQCIGATYKRKPLGTIGDLGTLSFHDTKNIQCGEGGALLVTNEKYLERAEIIREKGTNRAKFLRGEIDKYTWVDIGSSYLPSELNAAFLLAQLKAEKQVTTKRKELWDNYYSLLQPLSEKGLLEIANIPADCMHNGHLFFIKCKDIEERQALIESLKSKDIYSVFHYIPLHTAKAGKKLGVFHGEDKVTTKDSERLLRLPMYYELTKEDQKIICEEVYRFYKLV